MATKEKFDAIVVGAGPAGNAAAYTAAKAGLSVLQVERGEQLAARAQAIWEQLGDRRNAFRRLMDRAQRARRLRRWI